MVGLCRASRGRQQLQLVVISIHVVESVLQPEKSCRRRTRLQWHSCLCEGGGRYQSQRRICGASGVELTSETTNHEVFLAGFMVFSFPFSFSPVLPPQQPQLSQVVSSIENKKKSNMGKEEIKYLPDTPVPLKKALAEDTKEDCLPCRAIGISTSPVFPPLYFPFSPPPPLSALN